MFSAFIRNKLGIIYCSASILTVHASFIYQTALCIENSIYSVRLYNYSKEVYLEEVSEYKVYSSDPNFNLPDTPFQRIIKRNNNYIIIQSGKQIAGGSPPSSKYLSDTGLLNIHSREIETLRKKFSGAADIVDREERFVCDHINNKVIGIPILPAVEIFKSRTGDCTEHTILTIAILRSLNIQSRAVVGMVLCRQFGGLINVFVYHMWAEVYNNGNWVLVDSTRPGEKHHNRYVAFSYHHLKTGMPLSCLKAISAIKNLRVEYINNSN